MQYTRAVTTGLDVALAIACGVALILTWRHFNAAPARAASRASAPEIRQTAGPSAASFSPPAQSQPVSPAAAIPSAPRSEEPSAATPFDGFVEQLRGSKSGQLFAKSMMRNHTEIVDAPDDPAWSRPMEREIRDFIYSQPEAGTLEITSLICRSTGCEIQVLGPMHVPKPAPGEIFAGWQAVTNRLERSLASGWLGDHGTVMGNWGDRSLYVTTLKRRAERQ